MMPNECDERYSESLESRLQYCREMLETHGTPEPTAADTARFEQLLVHSAYDLGPVPGADTAREKLAWQELRDATDSFYRPTGHINREAYLRMARAIDAYAALRTTPAPVTALAQPDNHEGAL